MHITHARERDSNRESEEVCVLACLSEYCMRLYMYVYLYECASLFIHMCLCICACTRTCMRARACTLTAPPYPSISRSAAPTSMALEPRCPEPAPPSPETTGENRLDFPGWGRRVPSRGPVKLGWGGGGSICYRLLLSFCGFFFVLVICVITFLKMSVMAEIFLLLLVFGYSHHRTYASLIFTSLPLPGAHVRQAVRRLIPQRWKSRVFNIRVI